MHITGIGQITKGESPNFSNFRKSLENDVTSDKSQLSNITELRYFLSHVR